MKMYVLKEKKSTTRDEMILSRRSEETTRPTLHCPSNEIFGNDGATFVKGLVQYPQNNHLRFLLFIFMSGFFV